MRRQAQPAAGDERRPSAAPSGGAIPPAPPFVVWSATLVPVQLWIGEARRSRDLLAGSTLLSWLMARLLRTLRNEQNGGQVSFPQLDDTVLARFQGSFHDTLRAAGYGIPNRASGFLPGDPDHGETIFRALDAELHQGWNDLLVEIEASRKSFESVWAIAADEVRGAACPLHLSWCLQDGAAGDLASVDRLLTAVKRARAIPAHQGGPVPKCGQCGIREAAGGMDPAGWQDFWKRLEATKGVHSGQRLEPDERLCRVCLVKRLAGYLLREPFPSTSEIAARAWTAAVREDPALAPLLRALERAARRVPGFEARTADIAPFSFPRSHERMRRQATRDDDQPTLDALERVAAARHALARAIAERAGGEDRPGLAPSPGHYLAVVAFDGDNMAEQARSRPELGARIAGFQTALQRSLAATVEGSAVLRFAQAFYLGGDEGLLLAPAAPVLEAASAIHRLWTERMAGLEGGSPPTVSMGIALFDRERALGAALAAARRALRQAKEAGRDRLAVTALTASGSRFTAVAPWGESWARTRAAVAAIGDGRLAAGWPHDAERFLRTVPEEAWADGAIRDAARAELRRLAYRRARRREDRDTLWAQLLGERWWVTQPAPQELRTAADQLHLAAFLHRQGGPGVSDAR